MARVILEGLSLEQAKIFAEWYEGQGEQDAGIWFDERDIETPMTNVQRKGGFMEVKKDDVIIYCK